MYMEYKLSEDEFVFISENFKTHEISLILAEEKEIRFDSNLTEASTTVGHGHVQSQVTVVIYQTKCYFKMILWNQIFCGPFEAGSRDRCQKVKLLKNSNLALESSSYGKKGRCEMVAIKTLVYFDLEATGLKSSANPRIS